MYFEQLYVLLRIQLFLSRFYIDFRVIFGYDYQEEIYPNWRK